MTLVNWSARTAFAAALLFASFVPTQAQTTSERPLWDGMYVGLNLGYARGSSDASAIVPPTSLMNIAGRDTVAAVANGSFSDGAMLGGLTFGVARRTGQFVLGIEADLGALGFDGKRDTGVVASGFNGRAVDSVSSDWLATVRLRLGYAAASSLFYLTTGPAFSNISISRNVDWSAADPCPTAELGLRRCHAGKDDLQAGWTIGGGLEHALSQNWTIKAEYLYVDFGDAKFRTRNAAEPNQQWIDHKIDLNMHIGRMGVNYRF